MSQNLDFRYWIGKWGFYLCFVILGICLMSAGGLLSYTSVNPPSYSYDPNFRGFGIYRNSTEFGTSSMYIDVRINPATLYFQYQFGANINGTYNFVFWFPFYINGIQYQSENMSIIPTNRGSVVWLRHNTTVNIPTVQKISGSFLVDDTFISGSKGLYAITIPFGMDFSPKEFQKASDDLNVTYFSSNEVTLHIDLPYAYDVTNTFPPLSTGLQQWTPPISNQTIITLEWKFDILGETVIVRYEDQFMTKVYDNVLFFGGILFGIGSSLLLTAIYDWAKDWWGKSRKNGFLYLNSTKSTNMTVTAPQSQAQYFLNVRVKTSPITKLLGFIPVPYLYVHGHNFGISIIVKNMGNLAFNGGKIEVLVTYAFGNLYERVDGVVPPIDAEKEGMVDLKGRDTWGVLAHGHALFYENLSDNQGNPVPLYDEKLNLLQMQPNRGYQIHSFYSLTRGEIYTLIALYVNIITIILLNYEKILGFFRTLFSHFIN